MKVFILNEFSCSITVIFHYTIHNLRSNDQATLIDPCNVGKDKLPQGLIFIHFSVPDLTKFPQCVNNGKVTNIPSDNHWVRKKIKFANPNMNKHLFWMRRHWVCRVPQKHVFTSWPFEPLVWVQIGPDRGFQPCSTQSWVYLGLKWLVNSIPPRSVLETAGVPVTGDSPIF